MTALPQRPLVFVVWNGDEIDRAVAAAKGRALLLLSPPEAFGAPFFAALIAQAQSRHPESKLTWALDCGARGGLALAALYAGAPTIVFTGTKALRSQIADVARQLGARVISPRPKAQRLPAEGRKG